jgi:hypothetical protein
MYPSGVGERVALLAGFPSQPNTHVHSILIKYFVIYFFLNWLEKLFPLYISLPAIAVVVVPNNFGKTVYFNLISIRRKILLFPVEFSVI